jgi:PAS domain S-box-containing protein
MNPFIDSTSSDWKAFIDNFPDHIARFDKDCKHLYINRAIENEIQLPASQVTGKSNRELRIPNNNRALDRLETSIRFVFETGLPAIYYTQHRFESGKRYYFMKLIPGFVATTTQVESVWAITREITTLKEYEKKLRRSRKLLLKKNQQLDHINTNLDTFFYTTSHDLGNPLANIKAIVELLKNGKPEQVEMFVGLLEGSTKRLEDILVGLTELIEVGNINRPTNRWEFELILSIITSEFSEQLAQVSGVISADFSACPAIIYEKPYLESLFRNMLSNALKYRSSD